MTIGRSLFVPVGVLDFLPPSLDVLVLPGSQLLVDVEACVILLPIPLNYYPTNRKPGSLDAAVGGPHHCNGDPTLDTHACPGVGLPPLGVKAAGHTFNVAYALVPSSPSTEMTKGEKYCIGWR